MQTLAVTGKIGSGKSSVLQICKRLNAYTVDCDAIVAELLNQPKIAGEIQCSIHPATISPGVIDKRSLATIVFGDRVMLKKLETILDPFVEAALYEHFTLAKKGQHSWFVAEILRPADVSFTFDYVLEIKAPRSLRKSRLKCGNLIQRDRFFSPVKANWSINNTGNLKNIENELVRLLV